MVIMHVVAPCEFGGLERVVQMLGTGFGSLGHEVHVVSVVTESGAAQAFHGPLSEATVAPHAIVLSPRSSARERAAATPRAGHSGFLARSLLSGGSAGSAWRRGPMCCSRLCPTSTPYRLQFP